MGDESGNKTERTRGVRQAPRKQLRMNRRVDYTAKLSIVGREDSRVSIQ